MTASMDTDEKTSTLVQAVNQVLAAVLPGSDVQPLVSTATQVVVTAGGHGTEQEADALGVRLEGQLTGTGWTVSRRRDGVLEAELPGIGRGRFGVAGAAITFNGATEHGPAFGGTEAQRALAAEIKAVIRSVTPHAVVAPDDFGKPEACAPGKQKGSVRTSGWDPEEERGNARLIEQAEHVLTGRGWRVSPVDTDSTDRYVRISKHDLGSGLLRSTNGDLTFLGETSCAAL